MKMEKQNRCLELLPRLFLLGALLGVSSLAQGARPELKARPFPLSAVRVTDGVFKERIETDRTYLLDVLTVEKTDRLLAEFRRVAGLPAKADRYPGRWEGGGINGHSLGHYLTALSACYAATGDARAKERADYIVDELAACQEANGDGYVMTVPQADVWDKVRSGNFSVGGFDICGWWVPNYTIHKVFAGLRDAYRWTGNKKALEVERKLGDWYIRVIESLSDEKMQRLMVSEWGGLNETFADLAADTGDAKYLAVAKDRFNDRRIFDPLRKGEKEFLNGKHANTQMPKVTGLATVYEMTGDEADRKAIETYWDSVVNDRSFANGGHSNCEHFYPMAKSVENLGSQTAETCNINNLHRLTAHLFSWNPTSDKMDFVEKSLINQLLANIGRKPGEFGYFMSTRPVATKVFSTQEGAWWCCVGTGMENPMRYGEQAYFHDDASLWVNLYLPSTLTWREKGVTLEQKTRYPEEETIEFAIVAKEPSTWTLRLRKPAWCAKASLAVNGVSVSATPDETGYMTVTRPWKTGDRVRLTLPMTLRAETLNGSKGRYVAFLYGPLTLVGINAPEAGVPDVAKKRWDDHLAAPAGTDGMAMTLVTDDLASATKGIRRVKNELPYPTFETKDLLKPHDLTLMPYHRVYEEHYTLYFRRLSPTEWQAKAAELAREAAEQAAAAARVTDAVEPGFQQSEVNHDYAGAFSDAGEHRDRKYRHAVGQLGWFSYQMAVDAEQPMELVVTYFGADFNRSFNISVEGVTIATEPLGAKPNGDRFREAVYAVPPELTKGKEKVTVKFFANDKTSFVGGVFGIKIRRVASAK